MDARSIPAELRSRRQWVVWRTESRNGKPTKAPYMAALTSKRASVTDSATWSSFETAVEAAASNRVDGVGFVFTAGDPFVGVDLDRCIEPETGEVHLAAHEIIGALDSYSEWSPSRTGAHVIVEGELEGERNRTSDTPWGGVFEIYSEGRFFTMTGNGGGEIRAARAELVELVRQMFGSNGSGPSGRDVDDLSAPGANKSDRSLDDLLEAFSELGRIARHEGKPAPKDTSDSGWDFYLCCEAVRSGCTDGEIALLIPCARRGDSKATRSDYIKRTIARARKAAEADAADPAQRISRRWNLEDDPIVSGSTLGDVASGDAIVYLERRSGRVLRFPRLGDLFEPRKHNRIVSQVTRSTFKRVTEDQAHEIAQAIIRLGGGEDDDPLEQAREWVEEFVAYAGAVVEALDKQGNPKSRWTLLTDLVEKERKLPRTGPPAERSVIIRNGEELWLPAKRLREFAGGRITWGEFQSALVEIGCRREELDIREPTTRAGKADALRIHRRFWVASS